MAEGPSGAKMLIHSSRAAEQGALPERKGQGTMYRLPRSSFHDLLRYTQKCALPSPGRLPM